jgi:type IV pilus assembly protein PilN
MRPNINLATQPYEDVRRFTAIWTGLIGALLLSAIVLSVLVYKRWHEYRQVSRAISIEKNVLQELEDQQAQGLVILNRPENQEVRQRSDFLNQLILRKEVSWTKIFGSLEKMMPPRLRVLSVQPSVEQGQILISMQVGGDSRDRVAELVRRMERSKTFRNAQVVNETDQAGGGGAQEQDPMRFSVRAEYVPGAQEPERPESNTGGGE